MENASYIGLSRQMVLRRQMEVVANNIANMNTAGYRGEHMLFQSHMMEPDRPGQRNDHGISMVLDQAVVRDLRPGAMVQTGNPLDIAIVGEGYLVLDTPAGPRYSRNGHLSLDTERRIVDASGLPVMDANGGAISVPDGTADITISANGDVTADNAQIGTINIVGFDNELGLTPLGGGLYVSNDLPRPAQDTQVIQGSYENSNVQPIVEMTTMIQLARSYQSTQKFVQDEHERQVTAIRRLGQMTAA